MSSDSPKKKKMKLGQKDTNKIETADNPLKRGTEVGEPSCSKRLKVESDSGVSLQALKRKNFTPACQQVSYEAYTDQRTRLQFVYSPACLDGHCKHHDISSSIKVMPSYAEEAVNIEMKTNVWSEALEVCCLCITPDQYLSANVLKEVVEIIMNAHEDLYSSNTTEYLVDKSQEILALNFSTHPPCHKKVLKCYNDFLTSPMDLREKTFTNRTEFGSDKGIVKYCMNRLEYEISLESKDGPLIDKDINIPEEMRDSVKGLHWQKKKFEIFELLQRSERIQRIMATLESIIELLQFDLAIWNTRYTKNLGSHIMRTHKPLMAYILWSTNVIYTGAVNNNCRQILRLYARMVHLQYPEEHIRIMTSWLNVIVQTFYICETNSNCDYPNTGKYCAVFAREFYKIIADMPYETIIRILERIQPTFMQHLIATLHLKMLLSTQEDDILKIFITFLKKSQWKNFPEGDHEIKLSKGFLIKPKKVKNMLKYITKLCTVSEDDCMSEDSEDPVYPKFDPQSFLLDTDIDQSYVVHVLYIAVEAYLDAYNVQSLQDKWDMLNEQLQNGSGEYIPYSLPGSSSYSTSENFIKKYRSIWQLLTELILLFRKMKSCEELPGILKVFDNIGLLEL